MARGDLIRNSAGGSVRDCGGCRTPNDCSFWGRCYYGRAPVVRTRLDDFGDELEAMFRASDAWANRAVTDESCPRCGATVIGEDARKKHKNFHHDEMVSGYWAGRRRCG